MRPWILIGLGILAVLFVVGVLITALPKRRAAAEQEACKNNLKNLALFAAFHAHPPKNVPADKIRHEIPAGTIPLPGIAYDDRLSWVGGALPGVDQRQQNTTAIIGMIDESRPWSFEKNQRAARSKVLSLLCPGNPPQIDPEQPAPTQYVGIAGLGVDAAKLNFVPPAPASPRAGCFRYDGPTPFDSITDGLSNTLLFGERSNDLGPWLRGGPSTLRGLDDRPDAKPMIGPGGQFGGNHPNTSNWAIADGSIRSFTPRVDLKVLYALATIAGKEADAIPGE
jgi:hypothetical protein